MYINNFENGKNEVSVHLKNHYMNGQVTNYNLPKFKKKESKLPLTCILIQK